MAANTAEIRKRNLATVFHALRRQPGSSQRELASATGLDKATVSAIVGQLAGLGLLDKKTRPNAGRAGRPEIALSLGGDGILVGARLEPRALRLISTRLDGSFVARHELPGRTDVSEAVRQLRRALDALLAESGHRLEQVRAVGVGVPGLLERSGRLDFAPNFGWRDVALLDALRAAFPTPLFLDNEANAAALAEWLFGSCQDERVFLLITGHSGVGGALVQDGAVYRGALGYAGEVGHMRLVPGGRRCGCGGCGCLEAYLSEAAILARLAEAGLELPDLAAVAAADDPRVRPVLEEAAALFAQAVGNLVLVCNPGAVVLGGNLAHLARPLLGAARCYLGALTPSGPAAVRVLPSAFGEEAVAMGGVALALEGFLALL